MFKLKLYKISLFIKIEANSETVINQNVANIIKSEYVNRHKISNEICIDSEAAKLIFDRLYCSNNFKGYIQYISQNPFGVLLISEIQVRLFNGRILD